MQHEQGQSHLLKCFIETVLRGNTDSLAEILQSDVIQKLHDANAIGFNSVSKALMSYWMDNASNNDLLITLDVLLDDPFIKRIKEWNQNNKIIANVFNDHFSRGQIQSKLWLIDELSEIIANGRLGNVVLYGGWFGTLNWLLFQKFIIKQTYNIELDPTSIKLSSAFNEGLPFTPVTGDVTKLEWKGDSLDLRPERVNPNVIINTSAEHMDDSWFEKIPKDKFILLQTNDFFDCIQHTNCVHNLEEAEQKYKFSELLYSGTLDTQLYKRHMLIGLK